MSSGLHDAESRLRSLEDENSRYQKVIHSSKKHGELEVMLRDNNYLRNKLRDQEEDFRLQNNTLLQELSRVSICKRYIYKSVGIYIHFLVSVRKISDCRITLFFKNFQE